MRAVLTRAPITLSLGGSLPISETNAFAHQSLGLALDRYGLVVLRKGTAGTVHISLHGRCPESAFGLAADAIDWIEPAGLRRAGVDLSISAPGEFGASVSSAIAVAVVSAISAYLDLGLSPHEIAREAERLHARSIGWSAGWEHGSTRGGIHLLHRDGATTVAEDLHMMPGALDTLGRRLLLFSSGERLVPLPSGDLSTPRAVRALHNLRMIAGEMRLALEEGSLDLFGKLLDACWSHECSLPGYEPGNRIAAGYRAGLDAGALGGRALSPGMLLLYGSPVAQEGIEHTMAALGWEKIPLRIDLDGVCSSRDGDQLSTWPAGEDTQMRREARYRTTGSHNPV